MGQQFFYIYIRRSRRLRIFKQGAYVAIIISAVVGVLPYLALLGLITLPLGFAAVKGALRYYDQLDNLIPVLGRNVLLVLLCPLLMAIGIIVSLGSDPGAGFR